MDCAPRKVDGQGRLLTHLIGREDPRLAEGRLVGHGSRRCVRNRQCKMQRVWRPPQRADPPPALYGPALPGRRYCVFAF